MSKSLFEHTRFKLGLTKIELEPIPDLDMYIFYKVQEVEFHIFLIDAAKTTINI